MAKTIQLLLAVAIFLMAGWLMFQMQRRSGAAGDVGAAPPTTTSPSTATKSATRPAASPADAPRTTGALPAVHVAIHGIRFTLEVAATDASRARGLMFRKSMAARHGMLFVFDQPQSLTFWMENTLIPLDLIYLDSHGRVINWYTMKPLDIRTNVYVSTAAAQYAIELNAGWVAKMGLHAGETIDLGKELLKAVDPKAERH